MFVCTLKKPSFTGRCQPCNSHRIGKANTGRVRKRGKESATWKGGRHIDARGYVLRIIQPDNFFFCMADSQNRVWEHRLVMAQHLGRPLLSNESVHHLDGNPSNNNINNLILMDDTDHRRFENLLRYGKVKRTEVMNYVISN